MLRIANRGPGVAEADPTVVEWVEAALAGDHEAFAEIVYTYQDAVYNLSYRMLGESMEAEDAAQEVFLRAYANLHRYDPGRSLKTWLLSIASNHCIDRLRKRRLVWLSLDDEPLAATLGLSDDQPGPEEATLHNERSHKMQELLNQLSPDYRAAVVLRYWYDYSYTEIAQIMDTTESAIKSRLFRARHMLADMLNDPEASAGLANLRLEGG